MSGTTPSGAPFPPEGQTTFQGIVPSFLYNQYNDDAALLTFVEAFNVMQAWIVAWWNNIALPYYPGLSGLLLDWIGAGLYGYPRPTLSFQTLSAVGGTYGAAFYGQVAYAEQAQINNTTLVPVTDDVYQRMLTWHLYLGDGWQFTTRWLKQRVHRFLNGSAGSSTANDNTYDVSVTCSGRTITISIQFSAIAQIFQYAVLDGVLALPFQYSFVVVLTGAPAPPTTAAQQVSSIRRAEQVPYLPAFTHAGHVPQAGAPPPTVIAITRQEEVHRPGRNNP